MSLRVTVYGDKIDLADDLEKEFHKEAKAVVDYASRLVLREITRLLTLRSGTKQTAAPEGEPPEADTMDLARSFEVIPPRVRGRSVRGGVQSRDPGVPRLEFGATDDRGVRTLPHPFVLPAFEEMGSAIDQLVQDRLT